jgi:hypothetical protein
MCGHHFWGVANLRDQRLPVRTDALLARPLALVTHAWEFVPLVENRAVLRVNAGALKKQPAESWTRHALSIYPRLADGQMDRQARGRWMESTAVLREEQYEQAHAPCASPGETPSLGFGVLLGFVLQGDALCIAASCTTVGGLSLLNKKPSMRFESPCNKNGFFKESLGFARASKNPRPSQICLVHDCFPTYSPTLNPKP